MNYYERVQKSINLIEENINNPIVLDELATIADMSLTNYYRMFYSLVGYTVKDYIRRRRFSNVSKLLIDTEMRIIDIAFECQYESQAAFSRAFKQLVGVTPYICRKDKIDYIFERIDIMEMYFEVQNEELLKKYPDIKVIKKLEPMRVAYYRTYSKTPEIDAFKVLRDWAKRNELLEGDTKYRIFSFDAPDSKPGDEVYGFEVWMTIDDGFRFEDEKVKSKMFAGGMYAVTSTTVANILSTWDRFREWLKVSKYGLGTHQYLEEHLPFGDWDKDKQQGDEKVDLYMPIKEKDIMNKEFLSPMKVAYYRASGHKDVPYEAWETILEWAKKNKLFKEPKKHRFFSFHNRKSGKKFEYEVMVTIDVEFEVNDEKVKQKTFNGGKYITRQTNRENLPKAWEEMMRWRDITQTKVGKHQWIEEWFVKNGDISMKTEMKIYFPTYHK